MIYYGIDVRPLEQLYPELWEEFVQLDSFFHTDPVGMISLPIDESTDYDDQDALIAEQSAFEDVLKELFKLMSISLGIVIDQLPRKYYEIEGE